MSNQGEKLTENICAIASKVGGQLGQKGRSQQAVCYRDGHETGELDLEKKRVGYLQLAYRPEWFKGAQAMPTRFEDWENGMSSGKEG